MPMGVDWARDDLSPWEYLSWGEDAVDVGLDAMGVYVLPGEPTPVPDVLQVWGDAFSDLWSTAEDVVEAIQETAGSVQDLFVSPNPGPAAPDVSIPPVGVVGRPGGPAPPASAEARPAVLPAAVAAGVGWAGRALALGAALLMMDTLSKGASRKRRRPVDSW